MAPKKKPEPKKPLETPEQTQPEAMDFDDVQQREVNDMLRRRAERRAREEHSRKTSD